MSERPGLFAELKRRNVFRVAIFYVVTAWLVIEVAETVLPIFDVPEGVLRGLVVLLVIGLVPALGLSWIYELTPDGIKRDAGASPEPAATTSHKLNWATLVVAVAAIGLLIYDRLTPEGPVVPNPTAAVTDGAGQVASPAATTAAATSDASIAVLPFADLSPGSDQEYFADGMAEEILNALVRVQGLEVASRTSSFGFKGQESLGMPVIAERLSVRHVLEGSVRRAGDNLRITAQLIDAKVDRHLWSDTFDRPLTAENIFAIQEEIATAIVAALVDSLGIEIEDEVRLAHATENLPAYDMYLQARALFQGRTGLDRADELLRQALEQDPEFVSAWALRAAVQTVIIEYGYSGLSAEEHQRRGVEFAEQALALDPDSGMALATLANLRLSATTRLRQRHDLGAIIRDLERAIELDPHNSSALNWLGMTFALVGRAEDALRTFSRCVEVAPRFGPCRENHYDTLWSMGRAEEAYARMQAALNDGAVVAEYANFAMLAHFDEKTAFMLLANQSKWLPGWSRHGDLYQAFRNLDGDNTELLAELKAFLSTRPPDPASYVEALMIPLGDHDATPLFFLAWNPEYARYRRSPQFQQYVRAAGALDYWREHGFPPQCRPLDGDEFACD
jgi:TolB-like protein/Tfp pilus assembly protein PilF